MRISSLLAALTSLVLTSPAFAFCRHYEWWCHRTDPPGDPAPEISTAGSLVAITAVAAFAAVIRHRRRNRS